jgi:hypothetical protein
MNRPPSLLVSMVLGSALAVSARGVGAADLCQGLIQDKQPHPMTGLARPAVGQAVTDPQFGTKIRRVSAASGATFAIRPLYSTISAWNADESRVLLYHVNQGHGLYDGRTLQFIRMLDIQPADIEQVYWHTTDPDLLFYPTGRTLVRYRVSTGAKQTLRTFEFCAGSVTAGSDPMFSSWNSNVFGLQCDGWAFLYDVAQNKVTRNASASLGAPQPSASGTLAFQAGAVLNASMQLQRRLDLDNPADHASQGRLATGHDTYNTVAFDPGPQGSGVGSLVTFDMATGASRVIVGPSTGFPYPPSGTHVSSVSYRNPGWSFVSVVGNPQGQGVLHNEIVLADANSGRVCRVAHHRSFGRNNTRIIPPYWAEPHVVPSPSGTRVLFASDWGNQATVDTYMLELPAHSKLSLSVSVNAPSYRSGQVHRAGLAISNPGLAQNVDLLLLGLLPDGDQVIARTPTGFRTGRLSQPATLGVLSPNLDLRTRFVVGPVDWYNFTWTPSSAPGWYAWILLAVKPGSLADGRFDAGDVVAQSSVPYSFTP